MKLGKAAALGAAAAVSALVLGCKSMAPAPEARKYKDGEMVVPADYKYWPKKFTEIQRPDLKQIREVWVNDVGVKAKGSGAIPNGYMSVMELWSAGENADGTLMKGADGKLVKGKLLKVFVMAKGPGWGESVTPAELRTGDWVYSAFLPDLKTAAPDSPLACRSCHLPQKENDFMFRFNDYFRKS
jgi:hemoglobin